MNETTKYWTQYFWAFRSTKVILRDWVRRGKIDKVNIRHSNLMWQHSDYTTVCVSVSAFKWLSLSLSDECFFVLNERQVTLQSDSDPIKPLSFSLCLSSSSLSNRPSHQSEPEAVCYKSSGLGPAVLPLFDPPLQMCVTNKRPWKIKRPFQSMTDHIRS